MDNANNKVDQTDCFNFGKSEVGEKQKSTLPNCII